MIRNKTIIIVALIVAVASVTIGFAAFSSTLRISSSATVTPSDSTFQNQVYFTNYTGGACTKTKATTVTASRTSSGSTATSGTVTNGTSISGLSVSMTKDQFANYDVCVYNASPYTAYLKTVQIGQPTCTAGEGATTSLVQSACKFMFLSVYLGNFEKEGHQGTTFDVNNHSLAPGETEKLTIGINYDIYNGSGDIVYVDGPWSVEFGTTTLTYSTVD